MVGTSFRLLVLGFVLLTYPVSITQGADEKPKVFRTPGSYLGATASSQTDYVSGVLDALYHVMRYGPPQRDVADCLFKDKEVNATLVALTLVTRRAVRDANPSDDGNGSIVDALVRRLGKECDLQLKVLEAVDR